MMREVARRGAAQGEQLHLQSRAREVHPKLLTRGRRVGGLERQAESAASRPRLRRAFVRAL